MIKNFRLKKLAKITEPYPAKTTMPYHGRIRSIREHGGSIFSHIDKQQIYLKKDILEKKFNDFKELADVGDIIEVNGEFFTTKTGEKTILVKDWAMLAKSLRPLPEKWYGLKDKEIRFRKRYLDLLMNLEAREIFEKRSEIIRKIRSFLDKNNFIEVETPILQSLYGGASARPFKTHLNALNIGLYLRIAPELYLKRLLVGGFERIFEIGRCFRNEGMDKNHNPDFTMLEWYVAYWNWEDLMKFTEDLMYCIDPKIFPKNWDRVNYKDIVKNNNAKTAYTKLKKPTFVMYLPNMPLAKNGQALQGVAQGVELIKAFTEQNNPIDQRKAFEEQEKMHEKGDEEAQRLDKDFIEALEYGMPPAAGFGLGIDRLTMLLTGAKTLREVILFPTMRPKNYV